MDIDRRSVLRRAAQAATAGAAAALAAAGPPRHRTSSAPAGPAAAAAEAPARPSAPPPPPEVVRRTAWQAVEPPSETQCDAVVRAVFVHHTDHPNGYGPQEVPEILRSIYQDHRENLGWEDIGYNFLVDRFGTIYEGRLGSTGRPVVGAHTMGFNRETAGIGVIGTFDAATPVPAAVLDATARVAAWKLGTYGIDPRSRSELTSNSSDSRFPAGTSHSFDAISGHRDAFCTLCPGDSLYAALPQIVDRAARLLAGRPLDAPADGTGTPLRPAFGRTDGPRRGSGLF
ncbi:peptidoglycan recognition protein [Kitasatospora sp. NPDC094015]|uniref:peptidoglycan recognition protein family protein n=1 Tax=Kitasatospora sp. NPDC094015 TaxID=3155205 RepID=UPI00331ECAA9